MLFLLIPELNMPSRVIIKIRTETIIATNVQNVRSMAPIILCMLFSPLKPTEYAEFLKNDLIWLNTYEHPFRNNSGMHSIIRKNLSMRLLTNCGLEITVKSMKAKGINPIPIAIIAKELI
uniref:Uncharacterized protein n=1 Tax=Dictyoglomus turgidum TaxID=513050 RepID=A0A7C3WRI2_9BACT